MTPGSFKVLHISIAKYDHIYILVQLKKFYLLHVNSDDWF